MSGIIKRDGSQLQRNEGDALANVISGMSADERMVCDSIKKINQIRSFPLTAIEILEWKDTIFELIPAIDPAAVEYVVLCLISGKFDYEKEHGIRNIIDGLRKIDRTDNGGFKIRNNITW